MTPDQTGAITLFEAMDFVGETLLLDRVRDRNRHFHDLAILSIDVARVVSRGTTLRVYPARQLLPVGWQNKYVKKWR